MMKFYLPQASLAVSKIIICYGEIPEKNMKAQSLGRFKIQKKYPFENVVFLNIKQLIKYRRKKINFNISNKNYNEVNFNNYKKAYERNTSKFINLLSVHLKGIDRVYTHSPWGEYGHEDHKQIFGCIMNLKK